MDRGDKPATVKRDSEVALVGGTDATGRDRPGGSRSMPHTGESVVGTGGPVGLLLACSPAIMQASSLAGLPGCGGPYPSRNGPTQAAGLRLGGPNESQAGPSQAVGRSVGSPRGTRRRECARDRGLAGLLACWRAGPPSSN